MRIGRKKDGNDGSEQFDIVPSNLTNLYTDAIEDKQFTQIKVDLFASTIRKQIEGFLRSRHRIMEKIDGKKAAIKILSDLNQNSKKKFIKKNLDYRKVLRGEEVDEPSNFF